MRIMTWNVNMFNGARWSLKNNNWKNNNQELERKENAKSIFGFVTQNVINNCDIAILQEFPYREENWKKEFEDNYSNHKIIAWYFTEQDLDYCVEPKIGITVAIVKKDSEWKLRRLSEHSGYYNKKNGRNVVDYSNRFIELYMGKMKLNLLGVHARDAYNVRDWLAQKCEMEFTPHFIVGDFNAGNYIKDKNDKGFELNRNEFVKLSEGFIDVCNGMGTTNYIPPTQVDHILIQNSQKFIGKVKIRDVEYSKEYSDHFPLICSIDI